MKGYLIYTDHPNSAQYNKSSTLQDKETHEKDMLVKIVVHFQMLTHLNR